MAQTQFSLITKIKIGRQGNSLPPSSPPPPATFLRPITSHFYLVFLALYFTGHNLISLRNGHWWQKHVYFHQLWLVSQRLINIHLFFKEMLLLMYWIFTNPNYVCVSIDGRQTQQKQSSEVFLKMGAWGSATLLKRNSSTCFPVKFAKFLRTPILKYICERLLLTPKHSWDAWEYISSSPATRGKLKIGGKENVKDK